MTIRRRPGAVKRPGRAKVGPELTGRVRDLARSGEGMVETDRGLVLVPGALIGEQVRVRLEGRRGGMACGTLREVQEPSAARVQPVCPVADRCGGCPLMVLGIEQQREHKRAWVAQAVGKPAAEVELLISGASAPRSLSGPPPHVASPDPGGQPEANAAGPREPVDLQEAHRRGLAYRGRTRLHFDASTRGRTVMGFRRAGSHRLVEVASCAVLAPELNCALGRIRSSLLPLLVGRGTVQLSLGIGGAVSVLVGVDEPLSPEAYRAAGDLAADAAFATVALRVEGTTADAVFGATETLIEGADGKPLRVPVGGFSQAHATLSCLLAERVRDLASCEGLHVAELYAGHGHLSVLLAAAARTYHGVEADPALAAALRDNLEARGHGRARVHTGDATTTEIGREVDVVVLDPPREGAKGAIEAIVRAKPLRIVYVSCDPATLGRDVRILAGHGYGVDRACAIDMFPHTSHVEAVVRLTSEVDRDRGVTERDLGSESS